MNTATRSRMATWTITCGSWTRSDRLPHAVEQWQVHQAANKPSVISIRLRNCKELPSIGEACELRVDDSLLFNGKIITIDQRWAATGEQHTTVHAADFLADAANRQSVRELNGTTRDIIGTLAQTSVSGPSGPHWDHVYQTDQADLDLLIACCSMSGQYVFFHNDAVQIFTAAGLSEPTLTCTIGEQIRDLSLSTTAYGIPQSVAAHGWDTGTSTNFQAADVSVKAPYTTGSRWVHGLTHAKKEQVQARAELEAGRRDAAANYVTAIIEGTPDMYPGRKIICDGADGLPTTERVCYTVIHRCDAIDGYVCEVSTLPPQPPPIDRNARIVPGVVSNINDPDKRARIQVTYPTYGDLTSPWIPVALPGIGNDHGVSCTHSVGDWVAVSITGNDLGQAIVLGGVTQSLQNDLSPRKGSANCLHLRTPGGQQVTLDDQKKSLTVVTNDGHRIELSPGTMELHAAGNLNIKAPGKRITITASSVDFQQG